MTKKLIFVSGNLYPFNLGGAEVFNYYLMHSMAKETEVLCINPHTAKTTEKVLHHKISVPFLAALWFPFFTALKLISVPNKKETHVVLTFSRSKWFYWVYYPLLKKLFGLQYTIIIHGGGLTKWGFKAPFKWFFRNADNVVGISERIRNEYHSRTGVEVRLMPPLIPFEISELSKQEVKERLGIKQEEKVLLQVGSLKEIKHPETAYEAFLELGKAFISSNNLVMVYAGDGPDRTGLEKKVADAGLAAHFKFLGNVERDEVKHVYKAADMYLIASDFEGTPLSMLEAMANEIPVMASNAPGINAVINHQVNGLLFTTGNGKELAGHVKTCLSNPDLVGSLVQNASQTIAERYDHGSMLDSYKKMWQI
jgi:glycosyltransferase involved in cell wall biosynthesis